jgi:hypothetical protein
MKKLRLDLDTLSVQAFETAEPTPARGTVEGHLPNTSPDVCPHTRNWYCTYGYECTVYMEYCLNLNTHEFCKPTWTCGG